MKKPCSKSVKEAYLGYNYKSKYKERSYEADTER